MPSISFQLYSARNFDLAETLALLQRLGIPEVEGFGPLYEDPAATKAQLDAHGLRMPTGHFGLDQLEANPNQVLDIARTIGIEQIIVPYLMPDDRPKDKAGWEAFGARLAAAGEAVHAAGLKFGWHNHDFEFQADADGHMPIQSIMNADARLGLELDLAWVHVAGQSPVAAIEDYQDRLLCVHVKDCAPKGENADEDGWADIGHGVMDWPAIHRALGAAGVERYILEHDNPSDITRFTTRSFETVSAF